MIKDKTSSRLLFFSKIYESVKFPFFKFIFPVWWTKQACCIKYKLAWISICKPSSPGIIDSLLYKYIRQLMPTSSFIITFISKKAPYQISIKLPENQLKKYTSESRNCESRRGFIEMLETVQVVLLVKKGFLWNTKGSFENLRKLCKR